MSEDKTLQDPNPLRRRPMVKQYAIITPDLYTGSMRKAGPYVLADWPWILCHMDPAGPVDVSARILADEIGGLVVEHQKALDWLLRPDPRNECQACEGRRLGMLGGSSYYVVNHLQYRLSWRPIAEAEYKRDWDRQHRPSGWQRAKAKRVSPQSD
jgi:hypothetical protein